MTKIIKIIKNLSEKNKKQQKQQKQQGTVLVVVLLISGLLALLILFSWNTAILQNQMASNYTEEILELAKAEQSLEAAYNRFVQNLNAEHIQFVPDNLLSNTNIAQGIFESHTIQNTLSTTGASRDTTDSSDQKSQSTQSEKLSGVDYYRIYSDNRLKIKLQATVAVARDEKGKVKNITRKTWEEIGS